MTIHDDLAERDRLVVALVRATIADDRQLVLELLADAEPFTVLDSFLGWATVRNAGEHQDATVLGRRLWWWSARCEREDAFGVAVLRSHATGDGAAHGALVATATQDVPGLVADVVRAWVRWEAHARGGEVGSLDAQLADWQAATTGR